LRFVVQRLGSTSIDIPIDKLGITNFFFGLEVSGDQTFRTRIAQSLLLLKMSSPKDLGTITNYLHGVRQGPRSGVLYKASEPVTSISDKIAMYSLPWCAGGLAHEAFHVKLYREDPSAYKNFKCTVESEGACIRYQRQVLKRAGGSPYELQYIDTVKSDHFDTNGDGKYTGEDWEMRNW
jgi:hypothetical protein